MNSQKMDTQTCRLLLIENKADLDIKDVSIRDVLNSLMWDAPNTLLSASLFRGRRERLCGRNAQALPAGSYP